jgi:ribosome-associated protein
MTISERAFSNEFIFQASRSSGPGGQNVNKVSSKVELRFNVADSQWLSEEEKSIIADKLGNKINSQNELVLVSQKDRSQLKNKEIVIEKFHTLLVKALTPANRRYKTKPTRSSIERRLESKKAQSAIKANRKGVDL